MATKSFLKNVNLRGKKQSQAFVRAAAVAQTRKAQQVAYSRRVSDMDQQQIRKIFGDRHE